MTVATSTPIGPTPGSAASVAPELPSGFRLVPALIGREGSAQYAWLPCPEWCDQDHTADRQVSIEDVWHSGPFVDLEMPHRDGSELLAYFRLGLDPYSSDPAKRRPFIFAEDGFTADGRYMDAEHVEAMCDRLEESLGRLRGMARDCHSAAQAAA